MHRRRYPSKSGTTQRCPGSRSGYPPRRFLRWSWSTWVPTVCFGTREKDFCCEPLGLDLPPSIAGVPAGELGSVPLGKSRSMVSSRKRTTMGSCSRGCCPNGPCSMTTNSRSNRSRGCYPNGQYSMSNCWQRLGLQTEPRLRAEPPWPQLRRTLTCALFTPVRWVSRYQG